MDQELNLNRRKFLKGSGAAALAAPMAGLPLLVPSTVSAVTPATNYASLPLLDEVDVLVVGGGMAGIGAALGAAQEGANTLIIENCAFFGGVASWMRGMEMNQMRPNGHARGDTIEALIAHLAKYGPQAYKINGKKGVYHSIRHNPEYFKVAVLDHFDEAGCKYLVSLRAADAIVENNVVKGMVVGTSKGLMRINASVTVDCTGDADVAHYAGAEIFTSPINDLANMTLGSNYTIWKNENSCKDAFKAARTKYPMVPKFPAGPRRVAETHFSWLNHKGIGGLDPTDPHERTKVETLSSKQIVHANLAMREFGAIQELKDAEMVGAGQQVSMRESRRLHGAYILTEDNAIQGTPQPDTIAWRSGSMDVGPGRGGPQDVMRIFDIPFRALLPVKVDGLIVAGRCISANQVAALSGKSMGNQLACGQGAGIAAAVAAKKGTLPRNIDVSEVQTILTNDGVDLYPADRSTQH